MTNFQEDFTEPLEREGVEEQEFSELFVGSIYDAHNKDIFGFEHPDSTQTRRPGACVRYDSASLESTLLKGTSREPHQQIKCYYVKVDHPDKSVLRATTYFRIQPFQIRLHKMKKLHGYGYRGVLPVDDLQRLQDALIRVFNYEGGAI